MPSPDLSDQKALRAWRVEQLKTFAPGAAVLPYGITVPLMNVYTSPDSVAWAYVVCFSPVILVVRGSMALLYPHLAERNPWAVRLGAMAAGVYLALIPWSLKQSLRYIHLKPIWMALCVAGTIAVTGYLWYAYKDWRRRGQIGQARRSNGE